MESQALSPDLRGQSDLMGLPALSATPVRPMECPERTARRGQTALPEQMELPALPVLALPALSVPTVLREPMEPPDSTELRALPARPELRGLPDLLALAELAAPMDPPDPWGQMARPVLSVPMGLPVLSVPMGLPALLGQTVPPDLHKRAQRKTTHPTK